jgi:hypothetical protein
VHAAAGVLEGAARRDGGGPATRLL